MSLDGNLHIAALHQALGSDDVRGEGGQQFSSSTLVGAPISTTAVS